MRSKYHAETLKMVASPSWRRGSHQPTEEMIQSADGREVTPDSLDTFEKEHSIRLPSSVREWYLVPGALRILYRTWLCTLYPDSLELKEFEGLPLIVFATDDVGVGMWAFRLDCGDDPEVLYTYVDRDYAWEHVSDSFSGFVRDAIEGTKSLFRDPLPRNTGHDTGEPFDARRPGNEKAGQP